MITRTYKKFREAVPFLEPIVVVGFMLLWFLLSGFLELAEEVAEGDTHTIDKTILMLLRDGRNPENPLGPPWIAEMVRDISSLGGIAILTLVTLSASVYLAMIKKYGQSLYLMITVIVGTALVNAMKFGYARPRPDFIPHDNSHVFTASFPSGHSMMSAMVYLSVGMLLARAQNSLPSKIFFLGISVFLTILVGISRIYLGVHWPSDVLAGWLAGGACAVTFWLVEWAWQEKILGRIKLFISSRG